MQMLEIDCDLSFFDTDPYEPMPGRTMSIWPFTIGRFTEPPYTLPQDFALFNLMGETFPKIWLEKIAFLEKYPGMALGIVHPDYSSEGPSKQIYESFLCTIKERQGYWHALPQEVTAWWKNRVNQNHEFSDKDQPIYMAKAVLKSEEPEIALCDKSCNAKYIQSNVFLS
jgi:hypothetical protein